MKIKADGIHYDTTSLVGILLNEAEYFDPHDLPKEAPEIQYSLDFRPANPRELPGYRDAFAMVWCSFKGYPEMGRWSVKADGVESEAEYQKLVDTWNANPKNSPEYSKAQQIWTDARNKKIEHYDYMSKNADSIYQNKKYSGD